MSFAGIQAGQILADYYLWEAILNEVPDANGIVELGTYQGGFSLYLAAQAEARGMFFRTYDVIEPERDIPGFVRLDIFAGADAVSEHLGRKDPVILFCDGGNKPRELRTFSRGLSSRSRILVHDWGTEMLATDVPGNVREIYGGFCDQIGSMTHVFEVVDA